ncbi:unnamed protein product [Hydatigera taeniaeformis]|uniref:Skp1_POZ domain-containing protein n=1 Tax=Hydatigena taeniaeformis TaxID=6205 RepID=A0A0R3XAW8_HYDTA|nr:unnamed protein product [Hydatigera taeniaeformis]
MEDVNSNTETGETVSIAPLQQSDQSTSNATFLTSAVGRLIASEGDAFRHLQIPCSVVCTISDRLTPLIVAYSQSIRDDCPSTHPSEVESADSEIRDWRAAFDAEFRASIVKIM